MLFINKRLTVVKYQHIAIIGVYLTTNDNSYNSTIDKENEFIQLTSLYRELSMQHEVIIIGDFSADIKRDNNHDKLMKKWLKTNKLICKDVRELEQDTYTFYKDTRTSWIDHIVTSNALKNLKNTDCKISKWNNGDHHALTAKIVINEEDRHI